MNSTPKPSQIALNHFDQFIESLLSTKITIDIQIEAVVTSAPVNFSVCIDQMTLIDQKIATGLHNICAESTCDNDQDHTISISMKNKKPSDTVIEHGEIVRDTWIKILDLRINNYWVFQDYDFFYNAFRYHNDDLQQWCSVKPGFWHNSTLKLVFRQPFDIWYQTKSTKNVDLAASMAHRNATSSGTVGVTAREKLTQYLEKLVI